MHFALFQQKIKLYVGILFENQHFVLSHVLFILFFVLNFFDFFFCFRDLNFACECPQNGLIIIVAHEK
jgi:hypothetical protein